MISESKHGGIGGLSRAGGRVTITIKYRLGHYKRELTTPSLSKKPKEKRASLFGQRFGLHMLSGSLKHVTHRHLCQRSKRHVMCAQGKALVGYTCGKLAEAYIWLVMMRQLKAMHKKYLTNTGCSQLYEMNVSD